MKDKDQKENLELRRQGSFALLQCFCYKVAKVIFSCLRFGRALIRPSTSSGTTTTRSLSCCCYSKSDLIFTPLQKESTWPFLSVAANILQFRARGNKSDHREGRYNCIFSSRPARKVLYLYLCICIVFVKTKYKRGEIQPHLSFSSSPQVFLFTTHPHVYFVFCICVCICVSVFVFVYLWNQPSSSNLAFTRLIDSGLYSCQPSVGDLKSVTVHVIRSKTSICLFSLQYCLLRTNKWHGHIRAHWSVSEIFLVSGLISIEIAKVQLNLFHGLKSFDDFGSFTTSIFIGKCKYFVLMQLFPPVNLSRPYHTFWTKTFPKDEI